jgi:hypothetical protein
MLLPIYWRSGDYAAREERIGAMAHLTLRIAGVF